MSDGSFLACDWGTTNLRAWVIGEGGSVHAHQEFPQLGVSRLKPGEAARRFREEIRPALGAEGMPALLCGMVGSTLGWTVVPYRSCPAELADLSAGLHTVEADPLVRIVPGLKGPGVTAASDVMRGEETQMMGLWGDGGSGWAVAPGTHSKWIRVEDGRIVSFRTFVTGELFAAVSQSAILSSSPDRAAGDDEAFSRGVERSLSDRAVTAALFSVRAGMLGGRLAPEAAPDYLSGLLIGAEIAAQLQAAHAAPVTLVGAPELSRRYGMALEVAGLPRPEVADAAEVTAKGLWRIWEART